MKRAVEFSTDFTIPKKTRSDGEPDLYSQVISDDQYDKYIGPGRYSATNKTLLNQYSRYQSTFQSSGSSTSVTAVGYNNIPNYNSTIVSKYVPPTVPNMEHTMQYPAEPYYQNSQPTASTTFNFKAPQETPKLGTGYKNRFSEVVDPSLPKVLTIQFQPLYCKLCEHQLSSNSMAKLHYDSKKHNKKVRQFLIDYAEETGEPLHPKAVQLSSSKGQLDKDPMFYHCTVCDLPLTGRLHAESHYMGKNHRRALAGNSPAGRGHFDATGKWVREIALKGVMSDRDNFGLDFITSPIGPMPLTTVTPPIFPMKKDLKVEDLRCELCDVAVTSDEQMTLHMNGQKHRKRVNQCMTGQLIQTPQGAAVVPTFSDDCYSNVDLSAFRTPTGNYYCEPCNTTVNSEIPFRQHLGSKKHNRVLSNRSHHNTESHSKPKTPTKIITCEVCNVPITSDIQLKIHVNGQKHKKLCEEKGIPDELQGTSTIANGSDNQLYYKYRTPSGLYYCKRCNLTIKTEVQFKAHITGKKHWSKVSQAPTATTSSK